MPGEGKAHRPPDPGRLSGWHAVLLVCNRLTGSGVPNPGGAGLNDDQRGPEHFLDSAVKGLPLIG
jgi:hypothetical protein